MKDNDTNDHDEDEDLNTDDEILNASITLSSNSTNDASTADKLLQHRGAGGSNLNVASSVIIAPASFSRSEGDGRDTADEQQQFSTVNNSLDDDRRSNINTEEQQNATENLKATVNINGVAVDHFHQNSDVDEEYTSQCNNNDIHGFIAYSSDNSMIELNLKFRKCTCNENSINISKENLQDVQRSNSTGMTDSSNVPPKGISDTGVFKKEDLI